jgi:sugar-specific transcriptional regulator TrmB
LSFPVFGIKVVVSTTTKKVVLNMDLVVRHLRNLGFTELEAKCLHVLSEFGTSTGYEIAKRLGVSRSNVYSALQKLVEKGVVLASKGEPTHFHALSLEDISAHIESDVQESIRYVKEHMPRQDSERTEYYTLEGDAKVLERLRSELNKASEEVLCELWAEEAELLREELIALQERGIRVLLTVQGEAELPGVTVIPARREELWQERSGRKLTIVVDRRLSIVGTRGEQGGAKAMLTEHPDMAELLVNHFYQGVILHELMKDMGGKLEDKYGKHFKKIVQSYTDNKRKRKK